MSRTAKWLLLTFLALMLYVAYTTVIGASEGHTVFPFHRVVGSIWVGYARDEIQLAAVILVLFAISLLSDRRSGGR